MLYKNKKETFEDLINVFLGKLASWNFRANLSGAF